MATQVTDQTVYAQPVDGSPLTEHIRATIDTGTGGAGQLASVSLEGNFGEAPLANGNPQATQGEVGFSALTKDSVTVDLANAPASSTITVDVILEGKPGPGGR